MNEHEFIEYSAKRYGIDNSVAETFVDMFADCLQELLNAGQSVKIAGLGKFESNPLFPNGLKHNNNKALCKLANSKIVSFKPSKQLTNSVT